MYTKVVANVKYFTKCHESLVSDIVMLMHPCSVLKNEFVYVQHEIAAHVFFVLKGKILVSRTLAGAKGDVKIGSHILGEHFGEVRTVSNGVVSRVCGVANAASALYDHIVDGSVRPRPRQRRPHVLSCRQVVLRAHIPVTRVDPEAQCVRDVYSEERGDS